MKRTLLLLLLLLAFASLSVGARQEPQQPPHTPEACARPAMKLKDHVGCDCELLCEKGQRIENPKCKAWCDLKKCACHRQPCCPDGGN